MQSLIPKKNFCGKKFEMGDCAWRCLDCERNYTDFKALRICKECFDKSEHIGHHLILDRKPKGFCICGDPAVWDSNNFCSDHVGCNGITSEKII